MTTATAHQVSDLVATLRSGLQSGAAGVAAALAGSPLVSLPGDPGPGASRLLHAEAELSVVALFWHPGRVTRIHDHLCWCAVHVLQGTVLETRYRARGDRVTATTARHRGVGSTSLLLPPDDIHRIGNDTADTAITLHVYGMDLRTGGSTRRRYAAITRPGSTPWPSA